MNIRRLLCARNLFVRRLLRSYVHRGSRFCAHAGWGAGQGTAVYQADKAKAGVGNLRPLGQIWPRQYSSPA